MKHAALYVRTGFDGQIEILRQVAQERNWNISKIFSDESIEGTRGKNPRPGMEALVQAVEERGCQVVMAWSMDTLSRSTSDLLHAICYFRENNCDLYIHSPKIDTTLSHGDSIFQICSALAEFDRFVHNTRNRGSASRARNSGIALGRPRLSKDREDMIRAAIQESLSSTGRAGAVTIGRKLHCGTSTVMRIKAEMAIHAEG